MQPEILAQWPLVSRLLDEALSLDEDEQRAWLAALPNEHAALRPVIERLLGRRDDAARFFERLPQPDAAAEQPAAVSADGHVAGSRVGPFELLQPIGRGGMGSVWLARRTDGALDLPVAVKLPFLEGSGALLAERFTRERQILAALNHPNIARLHEAGVTPEGQPYLALEYVEGESLLTHCERGAFTVRRRLELFLQVLRAVQYAHSNLVIHRDLKPSNLIVTATGDVKLLDFGIAKLLDRDTRRARQTELTQVYGSMMTLDYASPEQVLGEPLTTATDVYSLGVILFELLTGTRPYRLKRGTRAELEEAILTGAAERPSQAVTADFASSASTSLGVCRRALRGDLDTIVMKSLECDAAARYPTVDAFARDCERYLQGMPVLAQPQGAIYRLGKFVGRHRVAVGAAAAVLVALLVGLGTAVWQARVAVAQSRVAEQEAHKQRAVQSFLTALFDRNTRLQPDAAAARSMTVRELLIDASDRVQGSLGEAPTVKLELLTTVGRLLREIDEYERSATLNRQAIALAREHGLTTADAYVEALIGLATVARVLGHGPEAIEARAESLRVLDARGDRTSLLRARASINTVAQMAPDARQEIAIVQEGARLFEKRYSNDPAYFNALWILGNLYRTQQAPAEAAVYFERAIGVFERVGSRDFTNFGASHGFLAFCEFGLGKVGSAVEHYAQGMQLLDRHAGETALVTRFHRGIYAFVLHASGRPQDAHRTFDQLRRTRPEGGPTIVDFDDAVYEATGYLDEGRPRDAQRVLETYSTNWVEFGRRFATNGERWVSGLARAYAMQGRADLARTTLRRIEELPSQNYGRSLATMPGHLADAAWIEMISGDVDAAAKLIDRARGVLDASPARFDAEYVAVALRAAEVSVRRTDPDAALRRADQALSHLRDKADRNGLPYVEAQALRVRAEALLALGRAREALADLESSIGLMRRLHAPDSPWLLDALLLTSLAARQLDDPGRARALAAEARAIARQHESLAPAFRARLALAEAAPL
jgi:eukaryotic-like serine/threonine-protein kinase